jgi:hypothetical protein
VFLNDGDTVNSLVVGERLIISRDQTTNFGYSLFSENLNAKMPVEKKELSNLLSATSDYRRFNQSNFGD